MYVSQTDARVVRRADAPDGAVRYVRAVNWLERQLARLRSFNPLAVDAVLAVVFTLVGIATAFGQDISDDEGFREPSVLARRVRARDLRADRDPASLATDRADDLGDRGPGPPPRRLARGIPPAGHAAPHLHGGRVVPASEGGRRAGAPVRHDRRARARRRPDARHGRRVRRPRQLRRRLGARGRLPQPPRGDRCQGARGGRASRGGAPARGQGAGRGAPAHRPGVARRRRPLDVGHRRPGRGG